MHLIIGGFEIRPGLLGRLGMHIQEEIHQEGSSLSESATIFL